MRAASMRDPEASRHQKGLDWAQFDKIKKRYKLPLILKGIATAEDAKLAVEHGVDVIYVSNHGGRQLDQGLGSLDVLPEIVAVAKGKAKIIIDGGFCRGTDVVKAIALGADLVCVGRLYAFGMAAAGRDGIYRVLELLQDEMIRAMGLLRRQQARRARSVVCAGGAAGAHRRTCSAPSPTSTSRTIGISRIHIPCRSYTEIQGLWIPGSRFARPGMTVLYFFSRNRGGRFSRKARPPSLDSSVP